MMNKKGVSPLIGYVLLIVGVLIVSGLVFGWLQTYVPQESIECPAEASLFIKNVSCVKNNSEIELRLAFKNNGLFNLDGFLIRATDNETQDLATIDLVEFLPGGQEEVQLFNDGREPLKPNEEIGYIFDIGTSLEDIKTVEVIPAKFEIIDNKRRFTTCGNSKVEEIISCQTI